MIYEIFIALTALVCVVVVIHQAFQLSAARDHIEILKMGENWYRGQAIQLAAELEKYTPWRNQKRDPKTGRFK